jgi:radical SAM superfamily enzyme YgiQ (UPF0313 family)
MDKVFMFEPLALEYLAAGMMEEGLEVKILDSRIEPDIMGCVQRYNPDFVGVTSYTAQLNIAKKVCEDIKAFKPSVKIIFGGHHATVKPDDLNEPYIDAVVIGEGVYTLRELIRAYLSGGDVMSVSGLGIPSPDGLIYTHPREYTPLDDLPIPARYLTDKYRDHYFSEWFKPLASVRTSLGCTARCTFCALWSVTGGKYLRRSFDGIIKELRMVKEDNVFFCDDESMCDVRRMDALADEIKKAGIAKNYFLYARVDTIVRHPELFHKWAGIGLKQVFVGMEDFSDVRLREMKKNITSDQQAEAVRILRECGIMMYASFMVSPDYTPQDFAMLKAYVRKLKLTYATFTVMTPLPGTELYEMNKDKMLSHKPELFDMIHLLLPPQMPMEDFYKELAKLYQEAVPFYKLLPVIFRFGFHGIFQRLGLLKQFMNKVQNAHLDY